MLFRQTSVTNNVQFPKWVLPSGSVLVKLKTSVSPFTIVCRNGYSVIFVYLYSISNLISRTEKNIIHTFFVFSIGLLITNVLCYLLSVVIRHTLLFFLFFSLLTIMLCPILSFYQVELLLFCCSYSIVFLLFYNTDIAVAVVSGCAGCVTGFIR